MLKKGFRLKKNEDFSKVFRFGKPFFVGLIGCKVMKTDEVGVKVGLSFSKKLFPKAVDRNRIKRVFSHVIERRLDSLPDQSAIVLFYSKKPGNIEYQDVDRDICSILTRVGKYSK